MSKTDYKISHFNNELKLFKADKKEIIYSSFWFMEFGKTSAEIKDSSKKLSFSVTKKFQFWKWRMVYLITHKIGDLSILISQNKRNTVFKIELLSGDYEIKVHFRKKKSIYKNDFKIAEFDENLDKEKHINLLVSDEQEIKNIFLLYSSLLIGETDQSTKTLIKSQKQLESNEEPWF